MSEWQAGEAKEWSEAAGPVKPFVEGAKTFIGGKVEEATGEIIDVTSPIVDSATGKRAVIGSLIQMTAAEAIKAAQAASDAWDDGQGPWPRATLQERVAAIEAVVAGLVARRGEIVDVLMWEICKTAADAAKEFDRTMDYARASIAELRAMDAAVSPWQTASGVCGKVRRGPVGRILFLAPFNYPLNEMYAMLIPALLVGNTVTMKLPTIGGQCHLLTCEAFAAALPPGAINFVSGSGRKCCPPIMESGLVDMLGFIGGSKACDALIRDHPAPHRLKVFSQLEGKNMGIVCADADVALAAAECCAGSTSYNGQRCTAIKLVYVHEAVADAFVKAFVAKVAAKKPGLPWEDGVAITPLPEPAKPAYLKDLVDDAVAKGAKVVNAAEGGGTLSSGALVTPPILFPVTREMRLFHEEQFGPVIPVAVFKDLAEVDRDVRASWRVATASAGRPPPTQRPPDAGRTRAGSLAPRGPSPRGSREAERRPARATAGTASRPRSSRATRTAPTPPPASTCSRPSSAASTRAPASVSRKARRAPNARRVPTAAQRPVLPRPRLLPLRRPPLERHGDHVHLRGAPRLQHRDGPRLSRQERRDQGRRRGGGEVLALARAPLAFRRTLAEVDTRGLVWCVMLGLGWG